MISKPLTTRYAALLIALVTVFTVALYASYGSTLDKIDYFDLICDCIMAGIIFSATLYISQMGQLETGRNALVLGFSLLYFSLLIDVIDEVFINPNFVKNVGENLTQVAGYCIIFYGIFTWMNYNNSLHDELKKLSSTDALTGLLNRRSFIESATLELNRSQRYQQEVSVILVDIDHFKKINDNHGHSFGDHVLQEFSAYIGGKLRKNDLFCRWGGEEFIILVPDTNELQCRAIAEKLRQNIENKMPELLGKPRRITASFGCATLRHPEELLSSLIDRADQALYQAKSCGRNRVKSALSNTEHFHDEAYSMSG